MSTSQASPDRQSADDPRYKKVFQSRKLQSGYYDPQTQILYMTFVNGGRYRYYSPPVPESLWFRLVAATSPGSFFYYNVEKNFKGEPY